MKPSNARNEGELRNVLRKVSRHKSTVVTCLLLGMGVSWVVLDQTIPRYEAEAQVVLGIRSARIVKFDAVLSDLPAQPAVLRTEMDVITSRTIAERVVSKMSDADKKRLVEVSAIVSPLQGLVRTASSVMRDAERLAFGSKVEAVVPATELIPPKEARPPSSLPELTELVELVAHGVSASNDGQSYTIHIGYSSADPQLAAALANHYARAYIQNQLGSKAEAADRASIWLSQRLVELRHDLETSETAVQNYRHEADILQDKQGTVTAQQLAAINAQLVEARGERIEAASRVATLQSFLGASGDIESMPEVMSSPVIQGLRDRQADLKRKQAENDKRYTGLYPADTSLETDSAAIQRQIDGEVSRVAKAIRNGLAAAQAKEGALQDELVRLQRRFGEGSDAEVKLQLLQRESDANRAVYEAYLSRLKETTEQGKLQEPDSYLISSAVPPERPSYPRRMPLLFLGTLFGGLTGIAIALFCELFEQRLHSVDEVEEMTGLRVLALVPSLRYPRLFRPENYVLRRPRSLFNESLRTARTAIALSQGDKSGNVILVTSSIPGEGKTAFCLSLARSLAADHHRVLLVDSDLRRPMVGKAFGTRSENHLANILRGTAELYDSIQIDGKSGAHYIAAKQDKSHPQDLLNSERMRVLIDAARSAYDVVIIDAPPILVVADAAIIARYADHCVFLIRWGSTARDYVAHALRKLELYNVAVSGVVMSHVNMRRHARYASGEGYYGSHAHLKGRKLALWAAPRRTLSAGITAPQGE